MIEVTMKFTSMAEAAKFFAAHGVETIATRPETSTTEALVAVAQVAADPATLEKVVTAAEDKPAAKRGRKPAAAKTEEQTAPATAAAAPVAPQPETQSGEEQAQPTIDDLRNALDKYIKAQGEGGFAKGTALIRSFMKADGTPATRISEVQESDYAAFVAAAKV